MIRAEVGQGVGLTDRLEVGFGVVVGAGDGIAVGILVGTLVGAAAWLKPSRQTATSNHNNTLIFCCIFPIFDQKIGVRVSS